MNFRDIKVEGIRVAETLDQLPGVKAVEIEALGDRVSIVRVFGNVDFAIYALEQQGYGRLFPDETVEPK